MKELVVTLKNQPGEAHTVAKTLGENGINIIAVAVIANGETAQVHLVVSDPDAGEKLLESKGYELRTGDVLVLELLHSPGELSRLTGLLAENDVNITLLYGSGAKGNEAQLVLGVDDMAKAKQALEMDDD